MALRIGALVALLAFGCGSSTNETSATGGSPNDSGGGGGGGSSGEAGALADAGDDADAESAYPSGPYGNAQGDVLADMQLEGYLRHETTGLSYQAPFAPVTLAQVRATAPVAYAVVHLSGFT